MSQEHLSLLELKGYAKKLFSRTHLPPNGFRVIVKYKVVERGTSLQFNGKQFPKYTCRL